MFDHCSTKGEVTGSNPIEALKTFFFCGGGGGEGYFTIIAKLVTTTAMVTCLKFAFSNNTLPVCPLWKSQI